MRDDMNEAEINNIFGTVEAITNAINAYAYHIRNSEHRLEVGEVLSALFTVMVTSAQANPEFDADEFIASFTENLRNLKLVTRRCDA
jgi:hypothetical protein